jgi:hypothetical protein
MQMKIKPILLVVGLVFIAANDSVAQQPQPGSTAYNSVYLPAHGVGDTKRPSDIKRWGAAAIGKGDAFGWVLGVDSAEAAQSAALAQCRSNEGAIGCRVEQVFFNVCAALALSPSRYAVSSSNPEETSLAGVKERVLRQCGSECKIVREGCSMPSR